MRDASSGSERSSLRVPLLCALGCREDAVPAIDFYALRERVALMEVLELLGFKAVSRRGDQVRGRCPLHRSESRRSRSFSADLKRDRWHCFRCEAGGNALDLWMAATGLPVYNAALDLCQRLVIAVPYLRRSRGPP